LPLLKFQLSYIYIYQSIEHNGDVSPEKKIVTARLTSERSRGVTVLKKKIHSLDSIFTKATFKASVIVDVHKGREKHLALRVQRSSSTICRQQRPNHLASNKVTTILARWLYKREVRVSRLEYYYRSYKFK